MIISLFKRLIFNSKFSAGLPMLLSKNVGSSEEFLEENINGYYFNSRNVIIYCYLS